MDKLITLTLTKLLMIVTLSMAFSSIVTHLYIGMTVPKLQAAAPVVCPPNKTIEQPAPRPYRHHKWEYVPSNNGAKF